MIKAFAARDNNRLCSHCLLKASYVLVPKVITPTVDAGKEIEIEIYITGHGPIIQNKLSILFSSKYLIDEKKPGTLLSGIAGVRGPTGILLGPAAGKEYAKEPEASYALDRFGVTVIINEGYFMEIPNQSPAPPHGMPQLMSERTTDEIPPFTLKLKTSNKAPKADYTIDMSLTYSDGDEVTTDHQIVTIHLTDFTERHAKLLTFLAVVGTVVGVVVGILPFVLNYLIQSTTQTPMPPPPIS